jgi:hypothetical protein
MRDERFEVTVTFDERRGYIASAPELRQPIVALSLASLRKRIEIALLPDNVRVVLQLDGLAEREHHHRRAQAQLISLLTAPAYRGGLMRRCRARCRRLRRSSTPQRYPLDPRTH